MHIVVINRWADELAAYDRYIDHAKHSVTYVANAVGKRGLLEHCVAARGRVHEVTDLSDAAALARVCAAAAQEHGAIDRLLALSEFDLTVGAAVRTRLGIPGTKSDRVKSYKDKVVMKERVAAAGLAVPAFCKQIDSAAALTAFVEEVGFPVVLKPREGAASVGVKRIDEQAALVEALVGLPLESYECEKFVSGPIFHVDGIQYRSRNMFRRTSKYVNTCLDFSKGAPLGSFIVDDGALLSKMDGFTDGVLSALGLESGAFHLEVILADGQRPTFLEIGARIGGSEIPFVLDELYAVDLVREWIDIEVDDPSRPPRCASNGSAEVGGYLMIPEPRETPCKVTSRSSLLGTIATLYRELLPAPGQILDGQGGYEHIGGRFRFRGATSAEVERDIHATIARYELEYEPLTKPALAS